MSRVSILEQLKAEKRQTALEFDYNSLWAPPIMSLFTPMDIEELKRIATSVRYAGNISRKYDMIDAVMRKRGFRRAHCGTNRVVYHFLEDARFVAKVAVDSVGMADSPAEYRNQAFFQPFCCRIFEVDPSGVIAFIERVNPISSLEEFISVKDDIFNMMITKIIGKYIVDDLGTKAFMNFGIRMNSNGTAFGPVIIDFPYAYELDGAKLKCAHKVPNKYTGRLEECGGDIDYGPGFNKLYCNKCGREYRAIDLAKENNTDVRFEYTDEDKAFAKKIRYRLRARIIDNGKVIIDTGRSSNRLISKEELEDMNNAQIPLGEIEVGKINRKKKRDLNQFRQKYYSDLQVQYYNELAKKGVFNPVIERPAPQAVEVQQVSRDSDEISREYNGKSTSELMYDTYRKSEDSQTLEVWKIIKPDNSEMIMGEIAVLEEKTFPELNNPKPILQESSEALSDTKEETKIDLDAVESDSEDHTIVAENIMPKKIVSDQEVEKMVNEVKMNNEDASAKEMTSSIIDPEADAIAERSPFTRAYSDPRNSVHYNPIKDEINGQPVSLGPVSQTQTDNADDDSGTEDVMSAITSALLEEASKPSHVSFDEEDAADTASEYDDYDYDKNKGKKNKKHKRFKSYGNSRNLDQY